MTDYQPEGISVFVHTLSETVAREFGPKKAQVEHPDREFGAILHVEPMTNDRTGEQGFEVVVEALPERCPECGATDYDQMGHFARCSQFCQACRNYKAEGLTVYPPHNPSPNCESGGYPHCTCDTCF